AGERKVEDDETVDKLGRVQRQLPGHRAAPIVAHYDGFVLAQMLDYGNDVAYEERHVVVLNSLRFIAQVVAALVDGHALIFVGESFHLLAPRVPIVGKTVNHHDQRSAADGCVVNLHAIRIGVPFFHARFEIGSAGRSKETAQQQTSQDSADHHRGSPKELVLYQSRRHLPSVILSEAPRKTVASRKRWARSRRTPTACPLPMLPQGVLTAACPGKCLGLLLPVLVDIWEG